MISAAKWKPAGSREESVPVERKVEILFIYFFEFPDRCSNFSSEFVKRIFAKSLKRKKKKSRVIVVGKVNNRARLPVSRATLGFDDAEDLSRDDGNMKLCGDRSTDQQHSTSIIYK